MHWRLVATGGAILATALMLLESGHPTGAFLLGLAGALAAAAGLLFPHVRRPARGGAW